MAHGTLLFRKYAKNNVWKRNHENIRKRKSRGRHWTPDNIYFYYIEIVWNPCGWNVRRWTATGWWSSGITSARNVLVDNKQLLESILGCSNDCPFFQFGTAELVTTCNRGESRKNFQMTVPKCRTFQNQTFWQDGGFSRWRTLNWSNKKEWR